MDNLTYELLIAVIITMLLNIVGVLYGKKEAMKYADKSDYSQLCHYSKKAKSFERRFYLIQIVIILSLIFGFESIDENEQHIYFIVPLVLVIGAGATARVMYSVFQKRKGDRLGDGLI